MRFMKPNKSTRGPSTIMGLAVQRAVTVAGEKEQVEEHRAVMACLASYRLEDGSPTRHRIAAIISPECAPDTVASHIEKRRTAWLWGHRVGELWTMLGLWESMSDAGWRLERYVIEDPPTILHYRRGKAHLVVLDILNWVDLDMAGLGEMTQLGRQILLTDRDDDLTESFDPERDADIVARAGMRIVNFVRMNDLGVCQKTAPAQALQAYRHRFGPRVTVSDPFPAHQPGNIAATRQALLPIPHSDKRAKELEQAAYFGGDCRPFFIGDIVGRESCPVDRPRTNDHGAMIGTVLPLYHLDCSAFYPSIMASFPWPSELDRVLTGLDDDDLIPTSDHYCYCASVLLDTPHEFPMRTEAGGMAMATGKFWTTLIGHDLDFAVKVGAIKAVGLVARYHTADLFTRFVSDMWYLRCTAEHHLDLAGQLMSKKIMNSLYGKFAQRTEQWRENKDEPALKDWGTWIVDDADNPPPYECRAVAGVVQTVQDRSSASHAFPAIAAAITAAGRQRMRLIRSRAGLGNVYYQDTDSVIVNELGHYNLCQAKHVRPGELGGLRIMEEAGSCTIRGPRDYTFGSRTVVAGQTNPTPDSGSTGYVLRERERLPSTLATNPGAIVRYARAMHRRKAGGQLYTINPSGWTSPLCLPKT